MQTSNKNEGLSVIQLLHSLHMKQYLRALRKKFTQNFCYISSYLVSLKFNNVISFYEASCVLIVT
jgi:hypothetical protein